MYDRRYAFVTCSKCHQKYQRIDYGCARHQVTCGYPLPAQIEPRPETALTSEEWQEFDLANGISSYEMDGIEIDLSNYCARS